MPEQTHLFELRKLQTSFPQEQILTSLDAAKFIRQFYFDDIEIYESFFLLTLNSDNRTTGYYKISQGGINGTVVDIRLIAKYALDNLATAVVIAHNHPSGSTKASKEDIRVTIQIKNALALFQIHILDHIILTKDSFGSVKTQTDIL